MVKKGSTPRRRHTGLEYQKTHQMHLYLLLHHHSLVDQKVGPTRQKMRPSNDDQAMIYFLLPGFLFVASALLL